MRSRTGCDGFVAVLRGLLTAETFWRERLDRDSLRMNPIDRGAVLLRELRRLLDAGRDRAPEYWLVSWRKDHS